jgi:hypothetical protein
MPGRPLQLTVLLGTPPVLTLSRDAIDALTGASVQTPASGRAGFQLAFETDKKRVVDELQRKFQFGLNPAVRVILVATLGGVPQVLCDGVVTQHQHAPTSTGRTTITITGEDLTILMDLVDKSSERLPTSDDFTCVNFLLAPYASLGIVPAVIPSPLVDFIDPTTKEFKQTGTDYGHINNLARRVGYTFYLEPGPAPGAAIAYWGPEIRVPIPQPALSVGMGLASNVASLSFTHATQQTAIPLLAIHVDKLPLVLPLPPISPLKPPLTGVPQPPVRVTRLEEDVSKYGVARAVALGLAHAANTADNVTASGQLDVATYGRFLRPRFLVGVRGASLPYDGLYYVSRVSTELRRGRCTQSFSLSRSGAFPNVPAVRV